MCNNKNLLKAKKEANDEFYTCEDDVKRELRNYDLRGLSVYCNCDDWRSSKFFHYLKKNFQTLGLRRLIATGFNECGRGYYASYDGKELVTRELSGNGDCFSEECTALLKEADIVITNPPFSLFKQYVKLLMDFRMKFIIVGTESGCTYKDVFPYVMAGKMWVGCNMIKKFRLPDGSIKKFGNICWYTNVISNGARMRLNESGRSYSNEYRKYDNYDAIEISTIKDIPLDYYGVMGVPVSYLKYLDPMLFEIVGVSSSSRENAGKYFLGGNCTRPILDGKKKFTRLFIKRIRHELLVS